MTEGIKNGISKAAAFWPTLIFVYAFDFVTKRMVVNSLSPAYVPHNIIGDYVRFTLAYNRDAAMGLSLGDYSRTGFTVTAAAVLVVLFVLYRRTPAKAVASAIALAMIAGGALGNLTDRIRSSLGVVDWIDVGIGHARFWTFNVADAAVSCGAVLLAILSLRREKNEQGTVS
jgi:signal peptidase II